MNLNRDFLKTLGGILIIGAIVVATFLYGNQQRQDQIRKEQQAKEQADQKVGKPAASNKTKSQPSSSKVQASGSVGGGSLPTSTPQTGSTNVWLLVIPAAAVGFGSTKLRPYRRRYSL